jgi:NDP-mannose synthase
VNGNGNGNGNVAANGSAISGRNGHVRVSGLSRSNGRRPAEVVITACGPGLTIPPYSTPLPSPLAPVGEHHAVIDLTLAQLEAQGFTEVTIVVGSLGGLVRAFCDDGSQWGVRLRYWDDTAALGPIGSLIAHLDELPPHFVVLDAASLTTIDHRHLLDAHAASGAPVTVATTERTARLGFDILELGGDDGHEILAFEQHPEQKVTVSTGVHALTRDALGCYDPATPLDLDGLVADLLRRGERPRAQPFCGVSLNLRLAEDYGRAGAEWDQVTGQTSSRR